MDLEKTVLLMMKLFDRVKINHVITNMTVNHDPNSIVSFHTNGAPVQTTFTYISKKLNMW